MDHEMDEDDNYPQYGLQVLGIERSLQYIQEKVDNIEKSKKLGIEAIHRRKGEIVQTALENDATLNRIAKSQETLQKFGKAATIGVACLFAFKVAKEGLGLIQWFLQRQKSKKKRPYETEIKQRSEQGNLSKTSASLDGANYNLRPRRLHARHWQV
jgi:hypothetical protein